MHEEDEKSAGFFFGGGGGVTGTKSSKAAIKNAENLLKGLNQEI